MVERGGGGKEEGGATKLSSRGGPEVRGGRGSTEGC